MQSSDSILTFTLQNFGQEMFTIENLFFYVKKAFRSFKKEVKAHSEAKRHTSGSKGFGQDIALLP